MKQIFILGSSSVAGVWSSFGGRSTLLKKKLHNSMFGEKWVGEKFECFNFGLAGATIQQVKDIYLQNYKSYTRDGESIVIINVWGNNCKAEDTPDNFISSPQQFEEEMKDLLTTIKKDGHTVIFVGSGYVDESKTNPKPNPLTGGCSYFKNDRKEIFDTIIRNVCQELDIKYLGIDIEKDIRIAQYMYEDWLHANDLWHTYIFQKLWEEIRNIFDIK